MAKVLLVEDNQDFADSVAMALQLDGHSVRVAYDGRAGLAAAAATRPEVAILDIGLPEMDGIELAHALRREHGSRLRLIACTGYADETTRQRMASADFDRTFTKPIDMQTLLEAVRNRSDTTPSL
ncbi:MAG TPA: response regulator [Casimicrobiaceae bacterium]|jgi:DNA-binding response OmpR family regulator|nr:response regulator [Casimicrobiaceae bacterium]